MPAKSSPAKKAPRKAPAPSPTSALVACWEDDPGDPKSQPPLTPITVRKRIQSAPPLPYKVTGAAPPPKVYQPGSTDFLYFANAGALRRGADFWGSIVPQGTKWHVGK